MRKVTVTCSCTITINVDDDVPVGAVLADLDCQINRGDMVGYDVEDAIVHLNEAEVTDSR